MSDKQVLAMPVNRFWFMSATIPRIAAEFDLRVQTVQSSVTAGGESLKEYRQHLIDQMGRVVIEAPRFDPVGWQKLKAMAG